MCMVADEVLWVLNDCMTVLAHSKEGKKVVFPSHLFEPDPEPKDAEPEEAAGAAALGAPEEVIKDEDDDAFEL